MRVRGMEDHKAGCYQMPVPTSVRGVGQQMSKDKDSSRGTTAY